MKKSKKDGESILTNCSMIVGRDAQKISVAEMMSVAEIPEDECSRDAHASLDVW